MAALEDANLSPSNRFFTNLTPLPLRLSSDGWL